MDILNNIVLILQRYWDLFLEGIGVTLLLSAIAVGCGVNEVGMFERWINRRAQLSCG